MNKVCGRFPSTEPKEKAKTGGNDKWHGSSFEPVHSPLDVFNIVIPLSAVLMDASDKEGSVCMELVAVGMTTFVPVPTKITKLREQYK